MTKTLISSDLYSDKQPKCYIIYLAKIDTIEQDQFSARISSEYYQNETMMKSNLTNYGGMSGSPIFRVINFESKKT